MTQSLEERARIKEELRKRITRARVREPEKDEKSRVIMEKVFALPQFAQAQIVQFYVDAASEVRTRQFIPKAMALGKTVIVPYCTKDEQGDDILKLFRLESMDELDIGAFNILEPKPELRDLPEKRFDVRNVDLILVPGVVFDRRGGRIGHGWGYYDKLLRLARPEAWLIGLAYECQVVDEVPMDPQDVFVDLVVTEQHIYEGKRLKETKS